MKSNFTKVLVASAATMTLGLGIAATQAKLFTPSSLADKLDLEWGVSEEGELSEDMINLGLPVSVSSEILQLEGVNPLDLTLTVTASLYQYTTGDDEIDPGFTLTPVLVKENEVFNVNPGAALFTANLFPEVLEVGNAYHVVLGEYTVAYDGEVLETMPVADLVNNPETDVIVVPAVSEELEFDAALINGDEELTLNTHSGVSVETAEAIRVNFINGIDVMYATYAIDQMGEDVLTVASGALSLNRIGYAAFEKPINFISGYQYKVTVKAFDTTEPLDENLNVVEPLLVEEYIVNGAYAMGVIGQPEFGIVRGQFEEDMINLGVPVRFPDLQVPFGYVLEDCEITVSASLFEVQPDEETSVEVGVTGPICLADAQLHVAYVEGGVVTAMLFPEMMEVGKHYAIALDAVTVMSEDEIVAELGEDDYYAIDFDVVESTPVYAFGEPVWYLDGSEEEGYSVAGDQATLGVGLAFPFGVVPANGTYVADVMLYGIMPNGAEGGIMPLSADDDDDIDPGFNNVPTVLPLYDEPMQVYGTIVGGVLRFNIGAEDLAIGNYYAIEVSKIAALVDDVEVMSIENITSPVFTVTEVIEVPELEVGPSFIYGEEVIALNGHSNVSVAYAEALAVNFENGANVKAATYTIDAKTEEGLVNVSTGALSINTIGYVAFNPALQFVSGTQYVLTIKAWDVTEIIDENLEVAEPIFFGSYEFNGACEMGTIGVPVFGVERGQFPEDMCMLGVPVRFPEMKLPALVAAEDCEITVSASLFEVQPDEETSVEVGVTGPICLAEAQLHNASIVGGVATAYLFPEMMEAGKHYAIALDAVTVIDAEGNIVAELGEDDYFAVDFDVIPYVAPIELGYAEFLGIENGVVDVEDTMIHGVKVAFPAANFGSDDAVVSVMATLYDVTEMGELAGDDIDNMGVVGPMPVAQDLFVGGLNVESGVYEVALFTEQFVAGRSYVISLETITVEVNDEVILSWDNVEEEWASDIFEVISTALEIAPAFISGDEQIALNSHAAVSVETAEALVVRFINGVDIKMATYAIDEYVYDEEAGEMVWNDQLASDYLSINTFGYAAFEPALTFVAGHQYVLTVKAWDVEELFDENWNMAQPIAVEEFTFNGAADAATLGEPVWGIERGELSEDMINLGVPVSFPEISLPFGIVPEESAVVVWASLNEEGAEEDELDPGFGLNAQYFFCNVEGGILSANLFAEQLEVGKTYTINLLGMQFYTMDLEEMLLDIPADYAVTFTVVPSSTVGINTIKVESAKLMYNLNGQKVNRANGMVILDGAKALIK